MAGPNLEIFKFGMYIMFPIGIMFYFGTNLDRKFTVPDFWPQPNQLHRIPTERRDIDAEIERLKARRLALREKRLMAEEGQEAERRQIESQAQTGAEQTPTSNEDGQARPAGQRSGLGQYIGRLWGSRE